MIRSEHPFSIDEKVRVIYLDKLGIPTGINTYNGMLMVDYGQTPRPFHRDELEHVDITEKLYTMIQGVPMYWDKNDKVYYNSTYTSIYRTPDGNPLDNTFNTQSSPQEFSYGPEHLKSSYIHDNPIKSPKIDTTKGIKEAIGNPDKPRMSLLPKEALWDAAKALSYGEKKYAPDTYNYRKGINYTYLIDAALRHIEQFNNGENVDKESGVHHIGAAIANLMMLSWMDYNKPQHDDRYKGE